jgi:Ferroportin1 (FPN1)
MLQVMHVLVLGVALSRWGLWTFDLAVSQMLQVAIIVTVLTVAASPAGILANLCACGQSVSPSVPCALSIFVNLHATLVLAGACGGWRPE